MHVQEVCLCECAGHFTVFALTLATVHTPRQSCACCNPPSCLLINHWTLITHFFVMAQQKFWL